MSHMYIYIYIENDYTCLICTYNNILYATKTTSEEKQMKATFGGSSVRLPGSRGGSHGGFRVAGDAKNGRSDKLELDIY